MLQGRLSCCLYIHSVLSCLVRVHEFMPSKKGTRLRSFHKISIWSCWTNQITVTEKTTRFASSQGNTRQFYPYPGFVTSTFWLWVPRYHSNAVSGILLFSLYKIAMLYNTVFVGDCKICLRLQNHSTRYSHFINMHFLRTSNNTFLTIMIMRISYTKV